MARILPSRVLSSRVGAHYRRLAIEPLEDRQMLSLGGLVPTTYDSGGKVPYSVAIGDLNGDGRPDLVVANIMSNNVGVLLGQPGGTFATATTYNSGGDQPLSVAIGDLNGDGHPDLAVANEGGNVAVLFGHGDGTFAAPVTYGSGGSVPYFVAIGDLNSDGHADLVVVNAMSNNVGVLLGQGNGQFAPAVAYDSGGIYPWSVAIGDLNGDGRPDLAVANSDYGGDVGVLLSQPDGTLAPPAIYNSGGGYPWSVAIGDLNGDGHADLAVTNAGPESTNVGVLLGHGDGTFATAAIYDCGGLGPQSVAIAHLNGDERADLVVVNAWSNSVAVLLGHGDGTFASPVTYSSGGGFTWSVAIGDLNGDGRPDLAVANSENSVAVLFNTEVSPPPTVVDVTPSLTELQAVPASPSTALLTDAVLSSGTLNLSVGTFAISTDNEQSAINPIDRALAWTGTWLDI